MKDLIQRKLDSYSPQTSLEQENALKEIAQEMLLYGLSSSGFFEYAAFCGGTCLRIVHGLDRFSEDLDFSLKASDSAFDVEPFLKKACESARNFGFSFEIHGKDAADSNVRSRFLKDSSVKGILQFQHSQNKKQKIQIKFELDVNPTLGATYENKFLDFPIDHSVQTHDLASLFAGKCHALLCRSFVKGRDWYDFSWYVSQKISPNWQMLANALHQEGPWKNKDIKLFSKDFVFAALERRIESLDWKKVREDVERFLKSERRESLSIWSVEFFGDRLEKMKGYGDRT